MKKLLIVLFVFVVSISASAQSYGKSKVLNRFYVGFDNEKKIKDDLNYNDLQEYSLFNKADLKLIRFNGYMYKNQACNIVLLLVDDVLYGVQYYPLRDSRLLNYISMLDKNFKKETNWKNPLAEVVWTNDVLVIYKEMTDDYREYFIHYNKEMLKKYPQYKDF